MKIHIDMCYGEAEADYLYEKSNRFHEFKVSRQNVYEKSNTLT